MVIFKKSMLLLLAVCGLAAVFAAPALASVEEGPGWELEANTYPTNLDHGRDEVQEITPGEGEPTFTLTFEEHRTASIASGASASAVRAALEALPGIGSGNVSVTEASSGVYDATFVGELGNMRVAEMEGSGASVSVKTSGAASGTIAVEVFNIGAGASIGTITVTDTLPPGLKAKEAGQLMGVNGSGFGVRPSINRTGVWDCTGNGPGTAPSVSGATVITCTNDPEGFPSFQGGGGLPIESSTNEGIPNLQPEVGIAVEAAGEASGLTNKVAISGGGARESASTTDPVTISTHPAHGGLVQADTWFSNANGTVDRQAGSHPYAAMFEYTTATALASGEEETTAYFPGGEVRGLESTIPAGIVGNLSSIPKCKEYELTTEACSPSAIAGIISVKGLVGAFRQRVYNMVPPPGEPAQLAFDIASTNVKIDFSVKTGSNYSIVADVHNIPQKEIFTSTLILWGVPQEASHNKWRAPETGCSKEEIQKPKFVEGEVNFCAAQQRPLVEPFLTLPTSCEGPQGYSWREQGTWFQPDAKSEVSYSSHDASDNPAGFTGCDALAFEPVITTSPDTGRADTPAGLTVEVKPPIGGLVAPNGLGTADIENTVVTLPEGFVVNPGQAAGLQSCGSAESALTTEAEKARGEEDTSAASCPNASKIGTVLIKSPLVEGAEEKQFEGNVYLLQSNPPELKLLVAASADGVNLKLVGAVHLNEQTGRLETKFLGTPELPFSVFRLSFSGGAQAALDTPTQCGTYTTNADFTPWSSPFVEDFLTSANFVLNEGPGGGPCPSNPLPFAPTLIAGATTDQAGGFTSFSMLLQRGDGQQRIEKLQFKIPEGLAGMISQVPLCDEADANAGTCPAASHVGHSVVTSGPGPYPLVIPQPGEPEAPIYLTGPYKGAPFGLSIVTPVIAGPFNLGTIVTRASIAVDPYTAQITVTTDALPQIVDGVPTDLREVDAVIDRPGFMFNPTNCNPQTFSGIATSNQGTQAAISSPFGMGSCQSLKFNPKFSVSTSGHTSRANGASLTANLSYPTTAQGTQADIASVKVDLPKQLPSRLSTLQKACTSAQFNANPAGCPEASRIGYATVNTQLLPTPLTGPVIFVSHGGEAFPSLTIVLQGDNVTVDIVGTTFISKAGITSTTFKTVPDVPFKTFTLTLPEGKYSALAANGNLCKLKLKMPTAFTAQNGLKINESTPISVTGCAKVKAKVKAKTKKAKKKATKKK
jgi:hypothetical protein